VLKAGTGPERELGPCGERGLANAFDHRGERRAREAIDQLWAARVLTTSQLGEAGLVLFEPLGIAIRYQVQPDVML
jgi:hypothetical protein